MLEAGKILKQILYRRRKLLEVNDCRSELGIYELCIHYSTSHKDTRGKYEQWFPDSIGLVAGQILQWITVGTANNLMQPVETERLYCQS